MTKTYPLETLIKTIEHEILSENKYVLEAWFLTKDIEEIRNLLYENKPRDRYIADAVRKAVKDKLGQVLSNIS